MKSTGILRRIDNLGRIVIPKEIRDNFKISEGEMLEIYIDNNDIVLKKHSLMDSISEIAQKCIDTLREETTNIDFIVTDRDRVIAATGAFKKKYLDKKISSDLLNLLLNRETIVENQNRNFAIIENEVEVQNFLGKPLLINGDVNGMVLVFNSNEIGKEEEKKTNFIIRFLSKYF